MWAMAMERASESVLEEDVEEEEKEEEEEEGMVLMARIRSRNSVL